MRAPSVVFACFLLSLTSSTDAEEWPFHFAQYSIEIRKAAGLEMEDPHWMHLHKGHDSAADSDAVDLSVNIFRGSRSAGDTLVPSASGIDIRYAVRGVPVSGWLAPSSGFTFTLRVENSALDVLPDGFHDISVEVRGTARDQFKPLRAFLHLTRGRPISPVVPIINGITGYNGPNDFGPAAAYVDARERRLTGHRANPAPGPWSQPPYDADLYLEQLAPNGDYASGAQLWWEDPPHPGFPFVRALDPNHGQDHRSLRVEEQHEKFPFRDGPRGVGWMSPYVTGQIDSKGGFAFVETGGPARYMKPDGEIITVAGWRVQPSRDPIWMSKPLATIRANMELRGQWTEGRGEFRTPLDLAIDPRNESVWYVAGYEDHCIWKIEIINLAANQVLVSVFAGSPAHTSGFADGQGQSARFNGPASLVFDPVSDALYVADQDNDAIRRISRSGAVTTLFGRPGMAERLRARGVSNIFDHQANRNASNFTVSPTQAVGGMKPDIYRPQSIRVDSVGRIVLLELGYGAIRQLIPSTGVTTKLGEVNQIFGSNGGDWYRGWAWIDVDRWGNSGPRDGIYWCKSVGERIDGESTTRFNEVYAWIPPGGGPSRFLFGDDWDPYPEGWGLRSSTSPPHYPWLVAVDPRGGLLVSGFGAHGISRLRTRRATDPVPARYHPSGFDDGRWVWASGAPWIWPGPPGSQRYTSQSAALKFGWNAHNYLGFADAWSLLGNETDEQLLKMFEAPAAVREDAQAKQLWLNFVRLNRGDPRSGEIPPVDFDGDGRSDLLWRNYATGDTHIWMMSGGVRRGSIVLPHVPSAWSLAAAADFTGDGKPDIVWRNQATGETHIWMMNGGLYTGSMILPGVPTEWTIVAAADFTADRRPDIVWRNQNTGETHIWMMNGGTYSGSIVLPPVPLSWSVQGAADYTSDGKPDIIWRKGGETHLWMMDGGRYTGSIVLPFVSADWEIVSTGNFGGDFGPDLVWRNRVTNETHIWMMNGSAYSGSIVLPVVPDPWRIEGP